MGTLWHFLICMVLGDAPSGCLERVFSLTGLATRGVNLTFFALLIKVSKVASEIGLITTVNELRAHDYGGSQRANRRRRESSFLMRGG